MKTYARAFLVAGVIIRPPSTWSTANPCQWWPDAVRMGIAFGAAAIAIVWKDRKESEMRLSLRTTLLAGQ